MHLMTKQQTTHYKTLVLQLTVPISQHDAQVPFSVRRLVHYV
jgi:hypothetical protein